MTTCQGNRTVTGPGVDGLRCHPHWFFDRAGQEWVCVDGTTVHREEYYSTEYRETRARGRFRDVHGLCVAPDGSRAC